ncbi:hypothetical protein DSO57_1016353 [Entomophthora muscae]|uniref:Uncharacterized protein n=1 Tax=Entomophthora muscae TaxID=34485 RepID=A0ACC2UEY8_9FUNG|nr:hypothetical protein DSO57_1016353 [Entomophthora muscae]
MSSKEPDLDGTEKEFTRLYKELCLQAPSDMAFDNPATHLVYYNTLKPHIIIHINLYQVISLQSLYHEAEKAEQTANALHKAQDGKKERPKDSPLSGPSNQHLPKRIAVQTTNLWALIVTVGSIMPGIICPSEKAQKARKLLSKLTKLTDLNQTVDQK